MATRDCGLDRIPNKETTSCMSDFVADLAGCGASSLSLFGGGAPPSSTSVCKRVAYSDQGLLQQVTGLDLWSFDSQFRRRFGANICTPYVPKMKTRTVRSFWRHRGSQHRPSDA